MPQNKKIRCAILGGGEGDLDVLGELHKRRDVEIAFVYDRNPAAVALEIAEIMQIPRVTRPEGIAAYLPVDYVVAAEPHDRFAQEIELVSGAEVLDHPQALERLAGRAAPPPAPTAKDAEAPYSVEDALLGFERLFDRTRLLKFLLDVAVESTGAANGSIMLYSPEARELYIGYASGLSERVVKNTRQKLGEGIAGTVASERRGKLIRQVPAQSLYAVDRDRSDIASAISVPLVEGDRLLGVLNVSSARDRRELTVEDLEKLERLSRRIARVVAESIKLREMQLRHGEMSLRQSVGELTDKPMSTGEKFALLSSLVAEMTGAEAVEVFVSTRDGDWLVLGGSNRRLSGEPDFVRCGKGALSRAYLERRTIVLTEPVDPHSTALASSFVFVPLALIESLGVLMVEFAERHRLDEFLAVQDSVALELSRFIASEKREQRLRSELTSLAKISEAAPSLLACRTLVDLGDFVARLVADALDCERVSVRLRASPKDAWVVARNDATGRGEVWEEEDAERFAKLETKRTSFHLAFLDVEPKQDARRRGYHSVLGVPILSGQTVVGGIVAYDKRAASAVEDATFSRHDETVLEQIVAMVWPVARSLISGGEAAPPSYDEILSGNARRLLRITEAEMSRADRYHQPFSLLVIQVPRLIEFFDAEENRALVLADEIRKGIQTRTRKSDFGCWIRRDTYTMATLEGTKRIKFLVSRLVVYLVKDLTTAGLPTTSADVLVGVATYPGVSRSPEALLDEAVRSIKSSSAE